MWNFNENFIFFAKSHCLLLFTEQWRVNDVNTAGTFEELFVPVSKKNDTSLKFDFFIYGSYFYANFCVLLSN